MANFNELNGGIPNDCYAKDDRLLSYFRNMLIQHSGANTEVCLVRLKDGRVGYTHIPGADPHRSCLPSDTVELIAHTHPTTKVEPGAADRATLVNLQQSHTWIVARGRNAQAKRAAVLWERDSENASDRAKKLFHFFYE